ncbi:propanediol utilization microcompartment protein PduB [Desulfosporosinus fructosivorans]|uniref:Propanediol utilization microcompartment protein PduB n=1 Tax=Desulfosporosinus fructosivorans TaxID=2018669 RepID=A0A4Z0R970_9FIRM|nr:propanediol utilization microcompartment protein PduB [Desulfosporosinus fructosivorans]TGE38819.1 propanediol utilization microcompartment protein PduB [Desulfosporosinus fructosivorans]
MQEQLIDKVMDEIKKRMESQVPDETGQEKTKAVVNIGMTEYVGTAIGDTIGLVIANVDPMLHEKMKIDPKYRSIGILGARTGAGPHIMAADEAVKATNTEIVSIELPRDTKGGAGHGCLILFGAEEVSDARRAIEVALKELDRTFGDVYANDAGHLEMQYTARASFAVNKAFGAPVGKAFGLIVGAPAAIGVLMSDVAVKTANVEIVGYASPGGGSHSNEAILMVTGDSGAVRQSVLAAKEAGLKLLEAIGGPAPSITTPYI